MRKTIKNACVIGSGIMGRGIAAHLANANIPVLMLDIKSSGQNVNLIAEKGLKEILNSKPSLIYNKKRINNIKVGNITDNLDQIKNYDWIIEAVPENIELKKNIFKRIDNIFKNCKDYSIISSNTSGLSIVEMCEDLSEEFQNNFLITHFFNPVRYMKLIEIVKHDKTDKNIIDSIKYFAEKNMGKNIVTCKNTPNFIANRIGIFSVLKAIHLMLKYNLTIEEVDYICGVPIGRPKSAVFKTLDLVGLDTFANIIKSSHKSLVNDLEYKQLAIPAFMNKMLDLNMLGRKTKQGFYKREGNNILVLDLKTLKYRKRESIDYDIIKKSMKIKNVKERINFIFNGDCKTSLFASELLTSISYYSLTIASEISDNIFNIDEAMKFGFNWDLGPFETLDGIGLNNIIAKMKSLNYKTPDLLNSMKENSIESFYIDQDGKIKYWNNDDQSYTISPNYSENYNLHSFKKNTTNIIRKTNATSLIDINDNVAAFEFNTKMNSIDLEVLNDISKAIDICEERNIKSLVLYNDGNNFSVGVNLFLIFMGIENKDWNQINDMCKLYQDICVKLKYSSVVTVAAPSSMTLGGGLELCLWCNGIQCDVESYMGLVEVAVGLIPGAGGNIEMIDRALLNVPENKDLPWHTILSKPLETVAMAKVGTSAFECKDLGYLSPLDTISMSRSKLLHQSKLKALHMVNSNFMIPAKRRTFKLPGASAYSNFNIVLKTMYDGGFISEHDLKIALKVAKIVSGGDTNILTSVSEQYLLDLEREAFLSLCGEAKTLDRIKHMLTKKKPLRN